MEEAPGVCRAFAFVVEHLGLLSAARLAAVNAFYGTIACAQYEPYMQELTLLHFNTYLDDCENPTRLTGNIR